MLNFLHIENVALIKQLDVDFEDGFTVLTGETGSGKSMVIDALNMVLGQRPPKDIIRHGENECYIYALFDRINSATEAYLKGEGISLDDDGVLMISRRYTSDGKSTFKINNRTVPIFFVKNVSSRLISINEQHDAYSLLNDETHIGFLDKFTESVCKNHAETKKRYVSELEAYNSAKRKLAEHISLSADRTTRLEFLNYQRKEIESAKLRPHEEEECLSQKEIIKNSELIVNAVKGTLTLLSGGTKPGAYDKISAATDNLEKIKDIVQDGDEIYKSLSDILNNLDSVIKSVSRIDTGVFDDPTSELDRIESRLDLISRLENKYGETVEDILAYLDDIKEQISELEQYDFTLNEYQTLVDESYEKARLTALELDKNRREGAKLLTDAINRELCFLDMENVVFKVEFEKSDDLTQNGMGNVTFFVRTNSGEPFKNLSTVSSGGELSRIMLALKTALSDCDDVDTIVFDEIDTGVSGKTSSKIGISLKKLSHSRQVLSVTHSAQVSAVAQHHMKIAKREFEGRTFTIVIPLDEESRVEEIARILGGVTITDSVIATARELLAEGKK